jgi:heme A synthase
MLGVLWIGLLVTWREKPELGNLAQISLGLLFIALGFGVINWLLMAPVWGALIHLLLGDLLWMSVCTTSIHRFFLIPKNNA